MKKHIIIALTVGALTSLIIAQEGKPPEGGRPPGGADGGPGGRGGGPGGQRPVSPMIEALDANKDGTIDAGELAGAVAALKKLDKNGDGKLTEDEFRPQRPGGPGGGGQGGPGGPGGQGGGRGQGRPPGGVPGGAGGAPADGGPQRPPLEK